MTDEIKKYLSHCRKNNVRVIVAKCRSHCSTR
jgi:hypothetical protein